MWFNQIALDGIVRVASIVNFLDCYKMGKQNVKKGVFITTSRFVRGVKEEYEKPVDGKTIRLIDGDELMNYLIRYEIGVKNVTTYKMFALDENYFPSL